MENITGYLIRYHRLQKNISQEGLCKGICVVSYLSKIEKGMVNAGEDIIHQLFSALDITFHDDAEFIAQYQTVLTSFFTAFFLNEDVIREVEKLQQEKEALLNSPLCIDFLLAQGYQLFHLEDEAEEKLKKHLMQLKQFTVMMNEEQSYLYYYLSGSSKYGEAGITDLEKAGRYKLCSEQKHRLGIAYYHVGRFGEAIENLRKSYDLASDEGNAYMMLENALFLGNCYCVTREAELMMKYYEKCERLARTMHRDGMQAVLQYNIGSSYLEWGELDKALPYLKQSLTHELTEQFESLLVYQKLALLYCAYHDEVQMRMYLQKADEELHEDTWSIHREMNRFVHLYCDEDTRYQEECLSVLERLCLKNDDLSYGYRTFHARYLLELYTEKRRYKEAYQLTQEFHL